MKRILLFILIPLFLTAAEEPPQEPAPAVPQLVDIFQASEFPGSGALSYKYEDEKTEKIELGKTTGIYGLGLVFSGSALPDPFKKDFQKSQILQVALGSLKTKEADRVPQFAAATLLSSGIPDKRTLFRLTVPNSSELKKGPVAVMLFTSPSSKPGVTDEEKLKETLFADGGSLIVTPQGGRTVSVVKSKTGKVSFIRQIMKIDWAANLATPFSTTKRSVVGSTQFAFFWPKDKAGEKLMNGIAAESLASLGLGSKSAGSKKIKP